MLDDGVGALLPGQADIGAKAFFRPCAFVAGLHDARTCSGDDHPAFGRDLAREFYCLLIFGARGQGAGRAEHGHLPHMRVRRKELECITQFAHGSLDDPHVSPRFHVRHQFESVFDDVRHQIRIIALAFASDEVLDAAPYFRVCRGSVSILHGNESSLWSAGLQFDIAAWVRFNRFLPARA